MAPACVLAPPGASLLTFDRTPATLALVSSVESRRRGGDRRENLLQGTLDLLILKGAQREQAARPRRSPSASRPPRPSSASSTGCSFATRRSSNRTGWSTSRRSLKAASASRPCTRPAERASEARHAAGRRLRLPARRAAGEPARRGGAKRVCAGYVTTNFFGVLGVRAAAGALDFLYSNFARASDTPRDAGDGSVRFQSRREHRRLGGNFVFWFLLAYGCFWGEIKGRGLAAFLALWVCGLFGLPTSRKGKRYSLPTWRSWTSRWYSWSSRATFR